MADDRDTASEEFAAVMHRAGVRRLGSPASGRTHRHNASAETPSPVMVRTDGAPPRTSASASPDAAAEVVARQVDALRERVTALTAERDVALARATRAEAALTAARTLRAHGSLTPHAEPGAQLSPPSAVTDATTDRAAMDALTASTASAPLALVDVLSADGFDAPARQLAEAVTALSLAGLVGKCMATLATTKPDGLLRLLQDKVAWVCDRCAADAPYPAIVRVPAPECDICGGSSVRAAALRLAEACRARGFIRVLIVGGSPRAHVVVREAVEGLGLELRCLDGTARQGLARAGQQTVWCDVGFVWGGRRCSTMRSATRTTPQSCTPSPSGASPGSSMVPPLPSARPGEPVPQLGASTMEPGFDVIFGDADDLGDLARRQALHVPQEEDHPVGFWYQQQGVAQLLPQTGIDGRLFWRTIGGPGLRGCVIPAERPGHHVQRVMHRWFPRAPSATNQTGVSDRSVEPRPERLRLTETPYVTVCAQQRFLSGIVGIRVSATDGPAEPSGDILGALE